jgi:hypothetical protein
MKHLILFEDYTSTELDLDPKIREEYIKKLEDLVSFPDLYRDDFETWMAVIDDVSSKYLDFDHSILMIGNQELIQIRSLK